MIPEIEKLKAEIIKIANNALYFDDSSDYSCALHMICRECGMNIDVIGEKYIPDSDKIVEDYEPCLVCGETEPDGDGFCPQCELPIEKK